MLLHECSQSGNVLKIQKNQQHYTIHILALLLLTKRLISEKIYQ